MFKTESQKNTFLEQTKAAREGRAFEKKKEVAVTKLQAAVRGWLQRIHFRRDVLKLVAEDIPDDLNDAYSKPAINIYFTVNRFLLVWKKNEDRELFEKLCRYLVASVESESLKLSYISVALNKEYSLNWIKQVKEILYKCCEYLDQLKPEVSVDMKSILLFLHTLVTFTSINTWKILQSKSLQQLQPGMNQLSANIMGHLFMKGFYLTLNSLLVRGLARQKVALKNISLSAIITLALRPLVSASFSDKLMCMFILHIMRVPALFVHLHDYARESITSIKNHKLLERCLNFLAAERDGSVVFDSGSHTVCLVANLIHLAHIFQSSSLQEIDKLQFAEVLRRLMSKGMKTGTKDSKLSRWHPLLGWMSDSSSDALLLEEESVSNVKHQLCLLWCQPLIHYFLVSTVIENSTQPSSPTPQTSQSQNFFKRALDGRIGSKQPKTKIGSADCPLTPVSKVFNMYHTCLYTLTPLRLDILTGLCYQDNMLYLMWKFIEGLGLSNVLKGFLDLLSPSPDRIYNVPEFNTLILFCECMIHYITLLDDIEMYEEQEPFKLTDFAALSSFLNTFIYKGFLNNLFEVKAGCGSKLCDVLHSLLMILYRRDSRRPYCPKNHWLIKDIKISNFISDLEKGKRPTRLMLGMVPHVIQHTERVQLFRKFVTDDKTDLGLIDPSFSESFRLPLNPNNIHSTLITIHRRRIVEDGYRQLALLSPQSLKGVIRVRFINEQGLDEAGIDQDGVFKEFLEETIKRVFDPGLNLFRVTSEERLYPSATSHLQENHLHLFEFVGRMLAKAVYEGIVVDVPFAPFFLSQVLGQPQEAPYSCIDELPSLDNELYKSLTFIKHYKGDVQDLSLTFSVDTEILGQLVTHELIPGGKAVPVTNQNKINYIYLMAHFRMHTQIKDQMAAFIRGFRSIISQEWLLLFSPPELQRLISGDNVPLDIADLRRHTQYYGGFHDSHRVVLWLWDILLKDFTEEERRLFLKFVTSCSKPPLLGFAHLEPSFSIRCVEVGDDEDQGDTIGSVIRGFFTIRKKDPQNRLPTSSTCFNLLKLPNYQRKSILREKLRYAITSNTGFELS